MKQIDLLDWLDETAVIKTALPANAVQHREWLKEQLIPVMQELEYLKVSPQAVSEALSYYAHLFSEKAQQEILKDKD